MFTASGAWLSHRLYYSAFDRLTLYCWYEPELAWLREFRCGLCRAATAAYLED